jgi:hypothetical protein
MSAAASSGSKSRSPLMAPEKARMSTRRSTKAITTAEREKPRTDAVIAIGTVEEAREKLEEKEFATIDQEYSAKFVAMCLQQLTYIMMVPADPAALIKSLAIILRLEHLDCDQHATVAAGAMAHRRQKGIWHVECVC